MTTNAGTNKSQDRRRYVTVLPDRWVNYIVGAVSASVTSAVTFVITAIAIAALLIGGLWLAYTLLPTNIFNIILAVVLIDILAGIFLRAMFARRKER